MCFRGCDGGDELFWGWSFLSPNGMAVEEGKNVAENNNVYHPITELVSRPKVIRLKFQPAIMYPRKRRSVYFCLFFFLSFSFGIVFFAKPGEKCEVYETVQIVPKVRLPNEKKGLLFVGVMTAKRYLSTRATAVYETWGKEIPGKIEFFSSEWSSPPENKPDLPLVPLKGVDDSYPPQKKSFLMLQYMWENYGDKFEWFLRADDDVYIRPERLEAFLRSVDSSKALFVGQAGRGNQEEFGLLSLEYDENFCMGGPGVIMSRETLSRVAPHVKYCLRNLYTNHEDVELGRCVQKFAGIPCTWSYEMQTIFYHNSSGNEAFSGSLKKKEIHRAITLHPVKKYKNLHRIHNYMMLLKIQDKKHEVVKLKREILSTDEIIKRSNFSSKIFSKNELEKSLILGQQPSLTKTVFENEDDILPWEFIQRSQFSWSSANPRRKIDASLKEGLEDITREVMEMINMYSKERGRIIDFKELLYGYQRLNPVFGADYILDMLLVFKKYRGRKMTVPVRRHTYAQQQFSDMSFREVEDGEEVVLNVEVDRDNTEKTPSGIKEAFEIGLLKISENLPSIIFPPTDRGDGKKTKMINFVVPLSGREEVFKRFIMNFEEVCLQNRENVSLTVVLFPSDKEDSVQNVLDSVKNLQKKYSYAKITAVPVFENFSRANALSIGAKQVEPIDLLFFIDVDIVFQSETLRRIRTNTILGKSVYFPIVYSEYDPEIVYNRPVSPNHFNFSDLTGYWRQYGFGIVSIYKSDLSKVGGFNTEIKGWGKEDVDLFDKFVAFSSNITIFRSVDPALVHVFHVVDCDRKLEPQQFKMCKATRADTYGSVKQLSEYYNNNRHRINTVSRL